MRVPALLLLLLLGAAAHGQEPRFADELDVEVVSVDVVAEGEDGAPVSDLAAEDFEVLDGGQPVRITHFAAGGSDAQAPLHLVVLFDDAQIQPSERSSAYAGIARQLERLLGAADRVLIARLGSGIQIVQPFTSDPALLAAALKRLEQDPPGVPSDVAARKAVLDEIRAGDAPGANALGSAPVVGSQMQSNAELAAGTSLTSVRAYAERRRAEVLQSLASLDRLVSALAGLPGRKAVLLVSPGFDLRPGEGVYRAWLEKYRATRASRGSGTVDFELPGLDLRTVLRDLAAGASANRVAVYATAPAGGGTTRPDPRNVGGSAVQAETSAGESLHLLTQGTGGTAVFNLEGIERLAGEWSRTSGAIIRWPGRLRARATAPGIRWRSARAGPACASAAPPATVRRPPTSGPRSGPPPPSCSTCPRTRSTSALTSPRGSGSATAASPCR